MGARVQNSAAVSFPGSGTMTHFTVWDAASGGTLQGTGTLGSSQGLPAQFAASTLRIAVGDSVFTDNNDIASVEARKAKITHIQAHSAAPTPGSESTSNLLGGRVAITWGTTTAT